MSPPSTLADWPLQKAVFDALAADADLMDRLAALYDEVPRAPAFPYVSVGEGTSADWSTKTSTGQRHTLTIHAFSRARGRQEAKELLALVHSALHNRTLALDGAASLVALQTIFTQTLVEEAGRTTHGVIRLRAFTMQPDG